jgi:hypothetical protein
MGWKQELDQRLLAGIRQLKIENNELRAENARLRQSQEVAELTLKALAVRITLQSKELSLVRSQQAENAEEVRQVLQEAQTSQRIRHAQIQQLKLELEVLQKRPPETSGYAQPIKLRSKVLPPRSFGFREAIRRANATGADIAETVPTVQP